MVQDYIGVICQVLVCMWLLLGLWQQKLSWKQLKLGIVRLKFGLSRQVLVLFLLNLQVLVSSMFFIGLKERFVLVSLLKFRCGVILLQQVFLLLLVFFLLLQLIWLKKMNRLFQVQLLVCFRVKVCWIGGLILKFLLQRQVRFLLCQSIGFELVLWVGVMLWFLVIVWFVVSSFLVSIMVVSVWFIEMFLE